MSEIGRHRIVGKSPLLAADYGQAEKKVLGQMHEVSLHDLLTDQQLEDLAYVIGDLRLKKVNPLDPKYAQALKELFTPWKDELEAKGVLPDYLAYAVAYIMSGGRRHKA